MLDDGKDLGIPDRTPVPEGLQYELVGAKPCNLQLTTHKNLVYYKQTILLSTKI
jgi:hypothetical protein